MITGLLIFAALILAFIVAAFVSNPIAMDLLKFGRASTTDERKFLKSEHLIRNKGLMGRLSNDGLATQYALGLESDGVITHACILRQNGDFLKLKGEAAREEFDRAGRKV